MQLKNLRKGIALGGLDTFNSAFTSKTKDDSKPSVLFMAVKEYRPKVTTEDTLRVVKESIQDSVYKNNRSMLKQLDKIGDTMGKIGDKLANVVEDFQKKQSSRNSRNRDRSNSRDREMIQEIDTTTKTEVEIEVETEVEIEAEIEEIAETIVEIEEDQTQGKVETTNRDLVQGKDTLTKRISVNTVIEQVIQHIGVSNLKTI